MSDNYLAFDCPRFISIFSAVRGIDEASLKICAMRPGSSIVEIEGDEAAMDATLAAVPQDGARIPNLLSVTDPRTGSTVVSGGGGGLSLGVIIAIAICGVAVVVLVVIGAILLTRRKGRLGRNSSYQPLTQSSFTDSEYLIASTPPPVATSSSSKYITLVLQHDVVDRGDGILEGKRGDMAFVTPEDWNGTEAWVWVKIGTSEGYVPRSFCVVKN